jgi:integrase
MAFSSRSTTKVPLAKWQIASLIGTVAVATGATGTMAWRMASAEPKATLPQLSADETRLLAKVRSLPTRSWDDGNPNILSAQELGTVLGAVKKLTPQHYPLVATLAFTGLRFGEASALRWEDIDDAAGLIRIRRAQWRGRISTTKTGKTRSVPLVPELAVVLREHHERLAKGLGEGWVFPSNVGKLHPKEVLRKPLKKALKAAGIERHFTQHGFRRTFNNLSRQIAGEIVTRSITGHVTQAMTEHYSHVGGARS